MLEAIIVLSAVLFSASLLGKYHTSRVLAQLGEEPVRDVLLSADELEEHARDVAAAHRTARRFARRDPLSPERSEKRLKRAYMALSQDARSKFLMSPAAEWLLDNFYVIQTELRHLHEVRKGSRLGRLPHLSGGRFEAFPRVYAIAKEIVSHTDGRVDEDTVTRFVNAYQSVVPLTMAELWALPGMLRAALIEGLAGQSEEIVTAHRQRQMAVDLVNCMSQMRASEKEQGGPDSWLRRRLRAIKSMEPEFVVELLHQLRNQGPTAAEVLDWLEERLVDRGSGVDELVRLVHHRQSAREVAMGNLVTSLKLLTSIDWTEFFERTSVVEQTLRQDPSGTYPAMDGPSRDLYRRAVGSLAQRSGTSEIRVAAEAIRAASKSEGEDPACRHVGYYLVGPGRRDFLDGLLQREHRSFRLRPPSQRARLAAYLGSVALLTGLLMWAAGALLRLPLTGSSMLLLVLLAIPASEVALRLVGIVLGRLLPPTLLPKLELRDGIPDEYQTAIVIPALLSGVDQVRELATRMEVHFLANEEDHLRFVLLGDLPDAPTAETPADYEIIRVAREAIGELNQRYPHPAAPRFYFLWRQRKWNARQGRWMGWERKRGASEEFNRLLRGENTGLLDGSGPLVEAPGDLHRTRFVITLDADTQMPRGTARRLVGAAAHPLNRPIIGDPRRVVAGYGLLQPRIGISVVSSCASPFARAFAGHSGLDPYTTAVSDVYQDLLGEGIFTGKGIYDVSAFGQVLDRRFPENAVLSHDLLEGSYVRVGLASDIELIDTFPTNYISYSRRLHRWIRGDWQLLPWLGRTAPTGGESVTGTQLSRPPTTEQRKSRGARYVLPMWQALSSGEQEANPLSPLSKWKILDNLRRSLFFPAMFAFLAFGLLTWPQRALPILLIGIAALAVPVFGPLLSVLLAPPRGRELASQLCNAGLDATQGLRQAMMLLAFVPHQAYLSVDAIVRTLWRVYVTRRHLLEWVTAADAEARSGRNLACYLWFMWPGEALTLGLALALCLEASPALPASMPLVVFWLLAPALAYLSGRRISFEHKPVPGEVTYLRKQARRMWAYFEDFIVPEDNWLPPDNYQEEPGSKVAHRTSPTNVGLYLMSTLVAADFGHITKSNLVDRLARIMQTIHRMEKWHGHLYNWYDSRTLEPLRPLFVSTVDSGNLAGYLWTLASGLEEHFDQPPIDSITALRGLEDGLRVLLDELEEAGSDTSQEALQGLRAEMRAALGDLQAIIAEAEAQEGGRLRRSGRSQRTAGTTASAQSLKILLRLRSFVSWLHSKMQEAREQIEGMAASASAELIASEVPSRWARWLLRFGRQLDLWERELQRFCPWLSQLERTPQGLQEDPQAGRLLADAVALLIAVAPRRVEATRKDIESALGGLRERVDRLPPEERQESQEWLAALTKSTISSLKATQEHGQAVQELVQTSCALVRGTDFRILFDSKRGLFATGYNLEENRLARSYYDIFASEARQASFVAIAKGDVPPRHWFRLSRVLVKAEAGRALASWSGTMFEYLMPFLVMRNYQSTLLDETYRSVVRSQVAYGRANGVPWGISESAFYAFDFLLNYQYQAFGVPDLGLKRDLTCDLVIAPYASLLALMVRPQEVTENLRALAREGAMGEYGFYEAVDYTQGRVPRGRSKAVVKLFMVHHLGMSLMAVDNYLNRWAMQRRFHQQPRVKATELLLQERLPRRVVMIEPRRKADVPKRRGRIAFPPARLYGLPEEEPYSVHLASNGSYHLMVNTAGSGYSRFGEFALSRWRRDQTTDERGIFVYLRDLHDGALWSATYQPTRAKPDFYKVEFAEDRAAFKRIDGSIETDMEIAVSTEHNAEVRRVSLTNRGQKPRLLEVTTFMELALAPHAADLAHPAFSNLFVRTDYVPELGAVVASRRARDPEESPIWLAQVLAVDGEGVGEMQYETDRFRFLGRGGSIARPGSWADGERLSGTTGAVLDPCIALRQRVRLGPGKTVRLVLSTLVGETREEVLSLARIYREAGAAERVFALAWSSSQIALRHLNLESSDAQRFQTLAARLIYQDAYPAGQLKGRRGIKNTCRQSHLWSHGLSGDLPIVLVKVKELREHELIREALAAHEYWRLKGLAVDLVILNEQEGGYVQILQDRLQNMISTRFSAGENRPGGVILKRAALMDPQELSLLHAAATVIAGGGYGSLRGQAAAVSAPLPRRPSLLPTRKVYLRSNGERVAKQLTKELSYFNGYGGFIEDGSEYVIVLRPGLSTPAPWINVIANSSFGFQVSESGAGYTWALNSRENKLTPWSNDPVLDPAGEAVYIRDEETGEFWTPTARPIRRNSTYVCRHGLGYSVFSHHSHGIEQELLMFVPVDKPVKILKLKLRNTSSRRRSLSATYYGELVLGAFRETASRHVVSTYDEEAGLLLATNHYYDDFAGRLVFAGSDAADYTYTGDRHEFIGRNGTREQPAAMYREELSGRTGEGYDPCAALMVPLALDPGEEKEVLFFLGQTECRQEAKELAQHLRRLGAAEEELARVRDFWKGTTGKIQITTPDKPLDLLVNNWLPYQVLVCRIWARSAFYQSGGAYGFRDQLQDSLAVMYLRPEVAREHILRAASRQFLEGDVQHWWHPQSGRGIRTRFSDDPLWLPFVVARYISLTGDEAILDEQVPFLVEPELEADENERYGCPDQDGPQGTLYEHCLQAIERSLRFGEHGLPLMGSGDWNDGMNRVGWRSSGESVWLAMFMHLALSEFVPLARGRGDEEAVESLQRQVRRLAGAVKATGWDGEWYRRAYFDDGTPLGSVENDEGRIDSLPQSWSVISKVAPPERAKAALQAVMDYLVDEQNHLIKLLTPPFDRTELDPGYIKSYVPGVRENGGQYTHAAVWVVLATLLLGERGRARQLLDMINPVNLTKNRPGADRYRLEPYVIAADVAAAEPNTGRGGWSWYTGAAGWYYQVVVRDFFGLRALGPDHLKLEPRIPPTWQECELRLRHGGSLYVIHYFKERGKGDAKLQIVFDGQPLEGNWIPLVDDGQTHNVEVRW